MEQKSKYSKGGPHLPNLKKSIKDPLTDNNIIKINIFVTKFFLRLEQQILITLK